MAVTQSVCRPRTTRPGRPPTVSGMVASSPFTATSLEVETAAGAALRLTARVRAVDGSRLEGWAAFLCGGRMVELAPLQPDGSVTVETGDDLPSRLLQARFVPSLSEKHFPSESESVLSVCSRRALEPAFAAA
jgi:hypothetical protein